MMITLDWDNYEVIVRGVCTPEELEAKIEEVREEILMNEPTDNIKLDDMLEELTSMRKR